LFEFLAKFFDVKQLGDVGQGVKVFLKLALRHKEEHDQIDGLVVERVEIDAFGGPAQSADHFGDQVGRGMGDADAKADAGAHGRLALFDDGGDGLAVFGFDLARGDEVADKFVNRVPADGGLHAGQNVACA